MNEAEPERDFEVHCGRLCGRGEVKAADGSLIGKIKRQYNEYPATGYLASSCLM